MGQDIDMFNDQIKEELVYEGLIRTIDINTTIDNLDRWAIVSDKFKLSVINNKIKITFTSDPTRYEIENLIQNLNRLGWFIASMLISNEKMKWIKFNMDELRKSTLVALQIEAKYGLEQNIHDINELYHVSATRRVKKILSLGLVPKAGEKISTHPSRIYLALSIKDADGIATLFRKKYPELKLSLFRIDFKGVRKNSPSIRIFNDPNFKGGFYTLSNIPPKFITWEGDYEKI